VIDQVARVARAVNQTLWDIEIEYVCRSNLSGACGIGSFLLKDAARRHHGLRLSAVEGQVFYKRRWWCHYWCEYEGHIVDVTASQFQHRAKGPLIRPTSHEAVRFYRRNKKADIKWIIMDHNESDPYVCIPQLRVEIDDRLKEM
jgi:hypothetical protein